MNCWSRLDRGLQVIAKSAQWGSLRTVHCSSDICHTPRASGGRTRTATRTLLLLVSIAVAITTGAGKALPPGMAEITKLKLPAVRDVSG